MISKKVIRQLEQVDWDFSEHLPGTSKTAHWYPGTFPAELPTTLIQAFSKLDEAVFDPYGGTGTTGLEAIRQGRKALLAESNPIGCLAAYTAGGCLLLKALDSNLLESSFAQVRQALDRAAMRANVQLQLSAELSNFPNIEAALDKLISPTPKIFNSLFSKRMLRPALAEWFEKETLDEIKRLLAAVNDPQVSPFSSLIGKTMVSAILRASSSQTKSWGHIADNVRPREFVRKEPFRLASQWLGRFETMISRANVTPMPHSVHETRLWVAMHRWSRTQSEIPAPRNSARLLITSPPYAGAIDYALAQRLSYYAFGLDEAELTSSWQSEFGARRKRNKPASQQAWADDLALALSSQLQYVSESAFAAFVLPHKDEGRDIATQVLEDTLGSAGWKKAIELDRSIRQVRARQSWTSIKRETIHLFNR